MRQRTGHTLIVALVATLCLPQVAHATVDVTRSSDGTIHVTGGDTPEQVTIDRPADGQLRVADASGPVTSGDATCTVDAATGTATCTAPSGAYVDVLLGGGVDTFDSSTVMSLTLRVDGGADADNLRVGAGGTTRIVDTTATDTIDMSHAEDVVTVRWARARARVAASCGGCSTTWTVVLPANPGTVTLGEGRDDVDLRTWATRGTTRWNLGDGRDRYFGSTVRRAIVDGGADGDAMVSYAPVDVLRGGAGADKIADFGGRGDVLQGGADIDALSSMDRQRDTLDGQGGRDFCLSPAGHTPRFCDSGPVRGMEDSRYVPITSQSTVLQVFGID